MLVHETDEIEGNEFRWSKSFTLAVFIYPLNLDSHTNMSKAIELGGDINENGL